MARRPQSGKTINAGRKAGGMNWKTAVRIEKAVQLEASGLPDADICLMLGLTPAGLTTMKRSPAYQAVRIRIKTGIVSQLEQGLAEEQEYLKTKVKEAVPAALQVLVDNLKNPDPKVRHNAATDLLDRDGHFAKVSRIGLPTDEQGGSGVDTTNADALIDLLKGVNNGGEKSSTAKTIGDKIPA